MMAEWRVGNATSRDRGEELEIEPKTLPPRYLQ
jgi:hypothetical protein